MQGDERQIEITTAQAALVLELQRAVDSAQEKLNILLAGILAGHGVTQGRVVKMDGTTLTVV